MGNFEKMVVLAVLFLSAIVLAVSLNDDGNEVEATSPLSAAAQRIEDQTQAPAPVDPAPKSSTRGERSTQPPSSTQEGPGYFLYGETKPGVAEEPAPGPRPGSLFTELEQAASDARILKSTRGLSLSAVDDFMIYDVQAGDTWNGLAMTFYGDGRYVTNLLMANEGTELIANKPIYVPVFDFGREARADRQPLAPEAQGVAASAKTGSTPAAAATSPSAPPTVGSVYVVQNGDSLSKIASKAYGNGKLWRPIYDANRDKLRGPDFLQVGMRLVIPDPERAAKALATPDPNRPRVR